MIPSSGRVPEQGSRWDRFGTEACGSDKIVSGLAPRVSEYMGIYRPKIRANGVSRGPQAWVARPPLGRATWPCGALEHLLIVSRSFQGLLCSRKNRQKVLSFLDLRRYRFSVKPKTSRKQQLALGTGLIC